MLNEIEQLIKMAKIAVERIDSGLALGECLDVSPLRQAINDAEQVLVDVETYDDVITQCQRLACGQCFTKLIGILKQEIRE